MKVTDGVNTEETEDVDETTKNNEDEVKETKESVKNEEKKYTDEEVNALGQDKIDKNKIYIGKQNDTDYKYVITVRELDLGDMILRIRTTTSNEEVTLPINKTGGLTIDWGETTGSEYADPNKYSFPTFTYPTAGNYKVKIKGEVEKDTVFGSYGLYVNKNLVGIEKWGENGFYVITTLGQNIGGIIPTPTTRSFRNVTSFERTFYGCTDLIGNIPKTLFKYSPNATTFYYTFYGCTGLSGNIPGDLVDNCPNAQVFTSMFANCSGLTGDAPKLWNISIATNFSNCFTGCTNLTNRNQIPQSWGGDKP